MAATVAGRIPTGLAVWTGGSIDLGSRNSANERSGFKFTTDGVSAGADYQFTPHLTIGFGGGYGHDSSDIGSDGSKSTADSYSAVLYGTYHPTKETFVDGILGYGWLSYDSLRLVPDTTDYARGHRNGSQSFGSLTGGYQYREDRFRITPYGRLDFTNSTLDRFSETAIRGAALTYFDQSVTTISGTLGFKGEATVPLGWGTLLPFLKVEFQHDFEGDSRATLAYADLAAAGPAYVVPGDPVDSNHVQFGAGAELKLGTFSVGLSYDTMFGWQDIQDHQFRLIFTSHF